MKKILIVVFVSLMVGLLIAADIDIETNDDDSKDLCITSSIKVPENASEISEKKMAKVDVNTIVKNLHKNISGKITKIELENENGNLIYSAEVLRKSGKIFNVILDAGNGKILSAVIDEKDNVNEQEKNDEKENDRD